MSVIKWLVRLMFSATSVVVVGVIWLCMLPIYIFLVGAAKLSDLDDWARGISKDDRDRESWKTGI